MKHKYQLIFSLLSFVFISSLSTESTIMNLPVQQHDEYVTQRMDEVYTLDKGILN